MKKFALLIFLSSPLLIFLSSPFAFAACNTTTLVTTPDSSSFATCWNQAVTNGGGSITVQAGTATWSSAPSLNTLTSGNITVTAATTVSFSGTPGSSGYSATWGDNSFACSSVGTCITMTACPDFGIVNSGTGLVTIQGFTFIQNATSSGEGGCFNYSGSHGNVGLLFYRNHVKMYPGNLFFFGNNGYGVAAQNELDDTSTGGGGPFAFGGDFASSGYLNWQDATNVGTNQGWVAERNIISFLGTTDGAVDSYYGAKFTFRFNNVKIQNSCAGGVGWNHGTDSGSFRSNVSMEIYGNYFDNETGGACAIGNSRGGTTMYFSNTHVGNAAWGNLNQQTYRCLGQASSANWGLACNTTASTPYPALNLNWTPVSPTITSSNATVVTLNAPDWQASHAYTCSTGTPCAIGPTSNNAAGYNYISTSNCTTSGTRPSFNQTFPPTTTTSDGSCSWLNVGGVLAASANPSVGGFLSTAPDTTCSSGGTCNYYMDGLGSTGYPLRDQIGRGHNQVLMPDYEWLNAGAEAPASVYSTDSGTTGIIASNRDYYSYTGSFTGATGVGSGSTGSRPSTCTTGTAYWNTSEGTWNNGAAGSGALDVCTSTNTWTSASYTPYTYPDPLIGGGASTAAGSLLPGSQLMRGAQMIQ